MKVWRKIGGVLMTVWTLQLGFLAIGVVVGSAAIIIQQGIKPEEYWLLPVMLGIALGAAVLARLCWRTAGRLLAPEQPETEEWTDREAQAAEGAPVRKTRSRQRVLSGAYAGRPLWRSKGWACIQTLHSGMLYLYEDTLEDYQILREEEVRSISDRVCRAIFFGVLLALLGSMLLLFGFQLTSGGPPEVMGALVGVLALVGAVFGALRVPPVWVYTVELRLRDGKTCVAEMDRKLLELMAAHTPQPAAGAMDGGEADGTWDSPAAPDEGAREDGLLQDAPRWGIGHEPPYGGDGPEA